MNLLSHKHTQPKGVLLLELLFLIGLLALLLPVLLYGLAISRDGKPQQEQRMKAVSLMKETQSAVKNVRDTSWSSFATVGTYHPLISGNKWTLVSGEDMVNGQQRKVEVKDVYRDPMTGKMVSGPVSGYLDPSTKEVIITVSWDKPYPSSVSSTHYLTRVENITYTQTTQAAYNSGTISNTSVVSSEGSTVPDDGQIQLGAGGGGGDWCQPAKSITQVDLPKSGVANAITVDKGPAADGATVYATTGDNASGVSFANQEYRGEPPVPQAQKTFDGYKTNAVFGEFVGGIAKYAYLATDNNSKEVVIIDLTQYTDAPTNLKYKEIGSIDIPGNVNASSIYVLDNKAYVLTDSYKLFIYDITNRAKNYTQTEALNYNSGNGFSIGGVGKKVLVNNGYAYIAIGGTTNNFKIINVANPAYPTLTGQMTVGTGQYGIDVFITSSTTNPTRAYFVTSYLTGKNNFFILNISNKAAPSLVGTGYSTNGMAPKGVSVVTGNRAIIVGTGGTYQYQVVKLDNETNLTSCAGLQYPSGVHGIASALLDNGNAYSYIITGDAAAELKIILGGAGGQYVSSGTFESPTFTAPYTTVFNSFLANVSQPGDTSIKIQVAGAPAVAGSCTGAIFSFVGPNGDPSQYFTPDTDPNKIQAAIPILQSGGYANPGQCFRYKVWFSSSTITSTPILYDFILNYAQ